MRPAAAKQGASREQLPAADAWYAWEPVQRDDNWLVSYVDLLSIFLAALVVLIGQMAAANVPAPEPTATATQASTAKPVTNTVSGGLDEPASSTRSRSRSTSREVRLARLVEERFQGAIRAVHQEQGLTLEISDAVLFDSARAAIRGSASTMLIRLATTLQESGDARVAVEGHTDNRPVQSGEFRSNWELAAARAYAVTRFLIDHGLAAERLRAVSYADTRPTADNETPAGRAANRRVELRVEFLPERS